MNVLMATSWNAVCGISDFARQAIDALWEADTSIQITPYAEALDPLWVAEQIWLGDGRDGRTGRLSRQPVDVLWLNYHLGLHSRWTPEAVNRVVGILGCRLLITQHDTRGEAEPDPLLVALHDLADAYVVHEPVIGLPKAILIRQGVHRGVEPILHERVAYSNQPVLGTVGFNQGWRQFDELARITADAGWALMILSCNATDADEARWRALNPHLLCERRWMPTSELVARLSDCDATAFVHACANTGTSGTIRLGIAARKPVFAVLGRQYRDLREDSDPSPIRWLDAVERLPIVLRGTLQWKCCPGIVGLAARDSWANQGRKYAEILKGL